MQTEILAPAAVLIIWSLIMLVWMAATRLPALSRFGVDVGAKPGGRGQDLDGVLPDRINWKAHNYNHLMEQPTLFYPVIIILALLGYGQDALIAAWMYTGLRVVHSLWQATINTIPVRLSLFMLSTTALIYLAVRALMAAM